MPRQYLQISNFAGGLNTQFDQRDIAGNELTDASNVQVYKSGQIYSSRVSTTVTTRGSGSLTDGKGLFLFKADNNFSDVNDSVEILALADISSSQVDFIEDPFGTPDNTNHLGTIDLGTETANGNFVYYYVDGALRISDYYRSGTTINESNTSTWFGHVDRVGTIPGGALDIWVTASNNLAAPSGGDKSEAGSAQYAAENAGFDVDLDVETTDDDGLWEATTYQFAQSFVYEGDQESLLRVYSQTAALSTNNYFTSVLLGLTRSSSASNKRIKGGRIYIRKKDMVHPI